MSRESIKNTISLMLITVIAGVLLGLVYEVTKEPIAREKQRAKEEAYKLVFNDAESFDMADKDYVYELVKEKGFDYDADIEELMAAKDSSGNILGYVATVTDHEGYGGDIQFAMGVRMDGTLNGISFLSIGETAGLGMKATEDKFKDQFKNKLVSRFTYTKSGSAGDDEIDALSGATITTNAVTNGVNAGLYFINTLIEEVNEEVG